jgi:hypothetical protein
MTLSHQFRDQVEIRKKLKDSASLREAERGQRPIKPEA